MSSQYHFNVGLLERILTFTSPVRWGFFALFIAISLFCFEISLSFYQIYLSLVEGVVAVTFLTEAIAFTMFILFGLAGLLILAITIIVGVAWYKYGSTDRTLKLIEKLDKDIQDVKKQLLEKEDGEEDGE
jgi:uncharacterized membrane protein YedE/YeeE